MKFGCYTKATECAISLMINIEMISILHAVHTIGTGKFIKLN